MRINLEGLQEFVRLQVADVEESQWKYCKITSAHYFRGRLNAADAKELNKLYPDRVIDDMLMQQGVVSHYLPVVTKKDGYREEKGIEVCLALEAYEQAILQRMDVCVIVAADTSYVQLVQKLTSLGIRVMVINWGFQYVDDYGYERVSQVAMELLEASTYPISMHEIIDNPRISQFEDAIDLMFSPFEVKVSAKPVITDQSPKTSLIINLQKDKGYGFIQYHPDNIFFHFSQMAEGEEYEGLEEGDTIEFNIGANERDGKKMAKNIRKVAAHFDTNMDN
jgi:cold shock CspA family protein